MRQFQMIQLFLLIYSEIEKPAPSHDISAYYSCDEATEEKPKGRKKSKKPKTGPIRTRSSLRLAGRAQPPYKQQGDRTKVKPRKR